jgi:uncharacterized membrane protein YeaQ/YmgE (transglycosylase-associated protein family)
MKIVLLFISLISGAIGGNVAGRLLKDKSLGILGNSIAGIVGGGLAGSPIGRWEGGLAGNVPAVFMTDIVGSAIGGGVLILIYALRKEIMLRLLDRWNRWMQYRLRN